MQHYATTASAKLKYTVAGNSFQSIDARDCLCLLSHQLVKLYCLTLPKPLQASS